MRHILLSAHGPRLRFTGEYVPTSLTIHERDSGKRWELTNPPTDFQLEFPAGRYFLVAASPGASVQALVRLPDVIELELLAPPSR